MPCAEQKENPSSPLGPASIPGGGNHWLCTTAYLPKPVRADRALRQQLLDPDVMWYSSDLDSNCTCNDKDDAVACIERNLEAWRSGAGSVPPTRPAR